jgi:hypothetical protein
MKHCVIISENREIIQEILTEEQFDKKYHTFVDYKDLDCVWSEDKNKALEIAIDLIKQADMNREYFGN